MARPPARRRPAAQGGRTPGDVRRRDVLRLCVHGGEGHAGRQADLPLRRLLRALDLRRRHPCRRRRRQFRRRRPACAAGGARHESRGLQSLPLSAKRPAAAGAARRIAAAHGVLCVHGPELRRVFPGHDAGALARMVVGAGRCHRPGDRHHLDLRPDRLSLRGADDRRPAAAADAAGAGGRAVRAARL